MLAINNTSGKFIYEYIYVQRNQYFKYSSGNSFSPFHYSFVQMMENDFYWVVVYTICLQDNTSADMAFLYCFNLLTQYFKAVLPSVKIRLKV